MKPYAVFIAAIMTPSAYAYEIPNFIYERYERLLSEEPVTNPDGSSQLGPARLFKRDGLRILHLKGDRFEMAYQHGRLLKDVIPAGALPEIAAMIENAARNSFPQIPAIVDPIIQGIYTKYSRSILNHSAKNMGISLDEYIIEAYGLSLGAQYDLDNIVYAFLSPEILQIILGQQMQGAKDLPAPTAVSECTDFAIPPIGTESGGYIIGRNTDYSLNGYFDRFPTVIYYNPTDGAQPYMTVTSAGVHTAGVVGYNASGIFLGVHTIPTWDTSAKGHAVFDVGQYVLRNAKNMDEAVRIFETMRPGAGWVYSLVSTKEGKSAAIELSNGKVSVRNTSGSNHIQSNHYLSTAMLSRNLDLNASINEDTQARYHRVESLISQVESPFTALDAVRILADKTDPYSGQVHGIGNVVATHFTVTSAVFDTGLKKVYVANGLAPVSLTKFTELPLIETFDPDTFSDEAYDTLEDSEYHRIYPEKSRAEQLYIAAKEAYEIKRDYGRALQILNDVVKMDPSNPVYYFMQGVLGIKNRDNVAALRALEHCASMDSAHHGRSCQYFIGRIKADLGEHNDAIAQFQSVLATIDQAKEMPLARATSEALKNLKRKRRLTFNPDTLSIFMPEGDVLAY